MLVAGVDPAFGGPLGLAVVSFNGLSPSLVARQQLRVRRSGTWEDRCAAMAQAVYAALCGAGRYELIAIEWSYVSGRDTRGGGNVATALRLAYLIGQLGRVAAELGSHAVLVYPVESKSALTGNERATKADMIAMANRLTGLALSEHEADAYAHALAAEAKWRRQQLVGLPPEPPG